MVDQPTIQLGIHSDFSTTNEVMKKHRAYNVVKQQQRELRMPYSMLFLATLEVTHGSFKKKLSTLEELRVLIFCQGVKTAEHRNTRSLFEYLLFSYYFSFFLF